MEVDLYTLALITDIYGAFWLAKSIIWRSKRQIDLESTSFYNGNYYLKAAQVEARSFGWFGFIFLTVGFTGQIVYQYFNIEISLKYFIIFIAFIFILGYFFNKYVKYSSNKIIPQNVKEKHGEY